MGKYIKLVFFIYVFVLSIFSVVSAYDFSIDGYNINSNNGLNLEIYCFNKYGDGDS